MQPRARQHCAVSCGGQSQQAPAVAECLNLVQQLQVGKVVGQHLVLQCHHDAVTTQPHGTDLPTQEDTQSHHTHPNGEQQLCCRGVQLLV